MVFRPCICTTARRGCWLVAVLCLLSAALYLATALYVSYVAHCGYNPQTNIQAVDEEYYADSTAAANERRGTAVYGLTADGMRTRSPVRYEQRDSDGDVVSSEEYLSACRSPWAASKLLWKALYSAHLIMSYIALIGAVLIILGNGARLNGFLYIFLGYAALEVTYRAVMVVVYGYFVAQQPANSMTILSLVMFAALIPLWIWSILAVLGLIREVRMYRFKVESERHHEDLERQRSLRFSHSYRGRAPSRAASVQSAHARKVAEDAGYVRMSISEADREVLRRSSLINNAINNANNAADSEAVRQNNAQVIYNTSLTERDEITPLTTPTRVNANGGNDNGVVRPAA